MTLNDGTPLPKPVSREVHTYSFPKSGYGSITIRVSEIIYPAFVLLSATCNHESFNWVRTEYLAGIVALRLSEGGWVVKNLGDTSAVLIRH